MNKEQKIEKCEHCFMPVSFTGDLQVYGAQSDEDIFLENKGFAFVECSECGENGYVLLQ